MPEIRNDDWLRELERLSRKNDQGHTTEEIARAIGKTMPMTRKLLNEANRLGWLTRGHRTTIRLDGRPALSPVYTIRAPKKGR